MNNYLYIKEADRISEELIKISNQNKSNDKKIIEIYNELLDNKYSNIKYLILSYIPERLSVKGYEIVNSEFFKLKKY